MKLQYLGYLAGSIASAAAAIVSFRANQINALEISPIYISWELIPNGEVNFPAKRITPPVYDDAQLLQATRFGGEVDVYVPQSDAAFDGGKLLTLSGPKEFPPHEGSIITIQDKSSGKKTEWKLAPQDDIEQELK